MKKLKCKSRGFQAQGKPKVYFCCHPQDFEQYFDVISNAILSAYDCVVFYDDCMQYTDTDDFLEINCFGALVVPVTAKLLFSENKAMEFEIPLAQKVNIPILPVMIEEGVENDFVQKFGDLVGISWNLQAEVCRLEKQLYKGLSAIFSPPPKEGSWIFLSHSSADIEKVRMIRNQFEKNHQNPLAFHLKCLRTDTEEGLAELENLIKREIDARDWFVFCESEAAKKSNYVSMEKDYIIKTGKKKIWSLDMSLSIDELLTKVDEICTSVKIFLSYRKRNRNFVSILRKELSRFDFDVWYDEDLLPGESFNEQIFEKINAAAQFGFFVIIIAEGDENSFTVRVELPLAISKGARVIALTIGSVDISQFCDTQKIKHYNLPFVPKIEDINLVASLIEAETRCQIKGPMHQADAYTTISKIQERLNYKNRYHSQEAVLDHVTGSSDDYLEIYRFPCCGKIVVGDGHVSRFRTDGCCCDQ